jgi:hypothetical protein
MEASLARAMRKHIRYGTDSEYRTSMTLATNKGPKATALTEASLARTMRKPVRYGTDSEYRISTTLAANITIELDLR